jgi:hypothetical protein
VRIVGRNNVRMPPGLNYQKFVRNVTVVGGAAVTLDCFSHSVGIYELLLQGALTLCVGLHGLFRHDDDNGDDDWRLPV